MVKASRRRLRISLASALLFGGTLWGLGLAGCSLAVDTESLTAGDEALDCTQSEKICPISLEDPDGPAECVSTTAPQNGCATNNCRPCEVPGAVARCTSGGECGIAICSEGFEDCDGEEDNGCEIDVYADEDNCGTCGAMCSRSNAIASCVQGRCEFVVCSPGYGNCDDDPKDGCEENIKTSNSHCGACGEVCAGTCVDGECM